MTNTVIKQEIKFHTILVNAHDKARKAIQTELSGANLSINHIKKLVDAMESETINYWKAKREVLNLENKLV